MPNALLLYGAFLAGAATGAGLVGLLWARKEGERQAQEAPEGE